MKAISRLSCRFYRIDSVNWRTTRPACSYVMGVEPPEPENDPDGDDSDMRWAAMYITPVRKCAPQT